MNNKKLSIILIIIGVVLLIVLANVFYIYRRNEVSKIIFNENDFSNTTWVNDNSRLTFKDSKVTFIINEDEVLNSNYTLDNRTGKLSNGDDKDFYIRSINEYSIIVWYDKAEYNLEKEVIAR